MWKHQAAQERDELVAKIGALGAYIASESFWALSLEDQALLQQQRNAMETYLNILKRRIARVI